MNGYLVLNKPAGMTSASTINKVKRLLPKGTKIGHTGTLDPNVTGVLAIAIGSATKSIPYLNELRDSDKIYRAGLRFGFETDTLDIWGEVTGQALVPHIELSQVEELFKSLHGVQMQFPPMYSALKKDGVRLYELARAGVSVEREARHIEIFDLELLSFQSEELEFEVRCSKGTYVRSLCSDIAKKLGTLGTMTSLIRLKSDVFVLEDAISLEELEGLNISSLLLDLNTVFAEFNSIELNYKYAGHILNGVPVDLRRFMPAFTSIGSLNSKFYRIKYQSTCIALAQQIDDRIEVRVRFCTKGDLSSL